MKELYTYIKDTFVPEVEKVYKDFDSISSISETSGDTTTETASADPEVIVGPGLHTVTAA
jgi:hypothetical protein